MILKTSNIRYMKLIGISLLLAAVSLPFNARTDAAGNSNPALQRAALVNNEQKLTASDVRRGHRFGFSVAISGSILVVGAEGDVLNDNTQDAVYIFERQAGSWVETQRLSASDGLPTHGFGLSVAIGGSTILVGAPFDSISGNNQGSVSVFERQGQSWVETQKLTGSDGTGGEFGRSVAFSGSTLVAGASESAFVFERHGGSWIETQKLTTNELFEDFGRSVEVSGSTVFVGAPFATIDGTFARGAVYVFGP